MTGGGKQYQAAGMDGMRLGRPVPRNIKCDGCGRWVSMLHVASDIGKPRCITCVTEACRLPAAAPEPAAAAEARAVTHLKNISRNDEWGTPHGIYMAGCRRFGIRPELDVAASMLMHKTGRYYTKEDDALTKEWDAPWYCNPPYSRVRDFITYGIRQVRKHGFPGLLLTYSKTDVRWWHSAVEPYCRYRFIRGRVKFELPSGGQAAHSAPYPSVFIYMDSETVKTCKRPPETSKYLERVSPYHGI